MAEAVDQKRPESEAEQALALAFVVFEMMFIADIVALLWTVRSSACDINDYAEIPR